MARVLIVDDDPVDREAAERCLATVEGTQVLHAADGNEALGRVRSDSPDLVLTDLRMPGMDGLALVEKLQADYPLIPVILMTSHGSERIAVQALQAGASSYVPKDSLRTDLSDTVGNLLELARARRSRREVLRHLGVCETHFELASDPELAYPLASFVAENLERLGFGTAADRTHIGIALSEAVSNAIVHGNLEVATEMRRTSQSAYRQLLRERQKTEPFMSRKVRFTAREAPEVVEYTVADEGPGFDPQTLLDPTAPENLTKIGGRGILLIRTFMDAVEFNAAGNAITMTKRSAAS
jgi:CheY-like chemotaxis protein